MVVIFISRPSGRLLQELFATGKLAGGKTGRLFATLPAGCAHEA